MVAGRAGRVRTAVNRRRPLDAGLAVYSAFSHRGVLGDPAAVYRKAREIAPHLRGVWVVRDEECAADTAALPPDTEHVVLGSAAYRRVTERATFFVNNVNWPRCRGQAPRQRHIHTHQGTPLKYMGADLLGRPAPGTASTCRRCCAGPTAGTTAWSRAGTRSGCGNGRTPCHFTSVHTGSPRNDVLVGAAPEDGRRVRERLGVPDGHTVVLYAPTRREYRRGGHVERIDLARLAADLGDGHTLVVRLHPSLATGPARGMGLTELHRRGVLIDATDEPHVEDLMLASDLLITDYSALMFDYALLDRPIVIHADDWGAYTASRGAYFDITAEAPGHVSRSLPGAGVAAGVGRVAGRGGGAAAVRLPGPVLRVRRRAGRRAGRPDPDAGRADAGARRRARCPSRPVRRPRPADLVVRPRTWVLLLAAQCSPCSSSRTSPAGTPPTPRTTCRTP